MSDPAAYRWEFEPSGFVDPKRFRTFSIGIYQWVPAAKGRLKKSKTIRVTGYTAEPQRAYEKAEALCREFNHAEVRINALPDWVQKQYAVEEPAAAKRETVKDRLGQLVKNLLTPELKQLGFRRTRNTLWRSDDRTAQAIKFTQGRWGTSKRGSFDVDLTVIWHEMDRAFAGGASVKTAPPKGVVAFWSQLRWFLPTDGSALWELTLQTDMATMHQEVSRMLGEYGIPWLAFRSDPTHVLDPSKFAKPDRRRPGETVACEHLGPWTRIYFLVQANRHDEARQIMARWQPTNPAAVIGLAKKIGLDLSAFTFNGPSI